MHEPCRTERLYQCPSRSYHNIKFGILLVANRQGCYVETVKKCELSFLNTEREALGADVLELIMILLNMNLLVEVLSFVSRCGHL